MKYMAEKGTTAVWLPQARTGYRLHWKHPGTCRPEAASPVRTKEQRLSLAQPALVR